MKAKLAAAIMIVVAGCGGSKKKPASPDHAMGSGSAGAGSGSEVVEKKEPPPPPPPPDTGGFTMVKPDALEWHPLSPDAPSPEMAVVHGDPTSGPSVFFLRIAPGGKAGVHIHTADYQAVVVSGQHKHYLAGGAKKAKPLDPGSHWFQPGGQAHDDECVSKDPCVLFVIAADKFDFTAQPKAKAPKVGKYAVHPVKDLKWAPMDPSQPDGLKLAVVYGDPKVGPVGFMLQMPPGANAGLHSHTGNYHAVVIDGAPYHWLPFEKDEGDGLPAGTYWFQPGGYDHGDRCTGDAPCHAFVFNEQMLDFKPAAAAK